MTKSTVINKFTRSQPPASTYPDFKRLGFEPLFYESGPKKDQVRKSVLQLYKYCQWYISELEEEALQHFRSPSRGNANSEVVSNHLVCFLRLRGPKFFSSGCNHYKAYPKLTLYSAEASDESLLVTFKPLRNILQSLAFVLNQREYRSKYPRGRQGSEAPDVEEEEQAEDIKQELVPTEAHAQDPILSGDSSDSSDNHSTWTEESDSEDDQGLAKTPVEAPLSRIQLRRATLDYQELPPTRHRKKRGELVTLKVNSARLLELTDRPETDAQKPDLMSSQCHPQSEASMPVATEPSPDGRPDDLASVGPTPVLPSPPTSGNGIDLTKDHRAPWHPAKRWYSDFFVPLYDRTLQASDEKKNELEEEHQANFDSDWYKRRNSQIDSKPSWGQMALALGTWNRPYLCRKIQELVSAIFAEHEDIVWENLRKRVYQSQFNMAVQEMDRKLAELVLATRPNCTIEYRQYCWEMVIKERRPEERANRQRRRKAPSKDQFPSEGGPQRSFSGPQSPASTRSFPSYVAQSPAFAEECSKSARPVSNDQSIIAQSKCPTLPNDLGQASLSMSGPSQNRIRREASSSSPRASNRILDRLTKSFAEEGLSTGYVGEDSFISSSPGTELASVANYGYANPPGAAGTTQKRQFDEIQPKHDSHGCSEKRIKSIEDASQQSTPLKLAIPGPTNTLPPKPLFPSGNSAYQCASPQSSVEAPDSNRSNSRQHYIESLKKLCNPDHKPSGMPQGPEHEASPSLPQTPKSQPRVIVANREAHGLVRFLLSSDPDGEILHITERITKNAIRQTFNSLQGRCEERIAKMKISLGKMGNREAIMLNLDSVILEQEPPYPKLKEFLRQPALESISKDGIDFLVEPVGMMSLADALSDSEE